MSVLGRTPHLERMTNAAEIGVVFGQRSQLWWDLPVRDSFRSALGSRRHLTLEFGAGPGPIALTSASLVTDDGAAKHFLLDSEDTSILDVLTELGSGYDLKDVALHEPAIEEVIRTFYQQKEKVRLGTMDAILVKPVGPWTFLVFSGLNMGYGGHIILAIGLMGWARTQVSADWSLLTVLYFIAALASAAMMTILTMVGATALIRVCSSHLYSIFFGFWELVPLQLLMVTADGQPNR